MRIARLALLVGFTRHHRRADHQIAQQRKFHAFGQAFRQLRREAEDIGGVVFAAIMTIQRAAFFTIDDANGQICLADTTRQRGCHPFAKTGRRRNTGAGQRVANRNIQTDRASGHTRILRLPVGGVAGLIGIDDARHQRVPYHVARFEGGKTHAINAA